MKTIGAALLLVIGLSAAIHYSKGQTCQGVGAAIQERRYFHMFVANDIIVFNRLTKNAIGRRRIGTRYQHFPRTRSVDAAFHPARNPTHTILVTGNRYYAFNPRGLKITGPRYLREIFRHNNYFARGIDAAAIHKGKVFFFKGCTMIVRRRGGDQVVNMRTAGIPCNVRAAWSERHGLVVATDRRAVLLPGSGRVSKPFCAFNLFTTRENICKCNTRVH